MKTNNRFIVLNNEIVYINSTKKIYTALNINNLVTAKKLNYFDSNYMLSIRLNKDYTNYFLNVLRSERYFKNLGSDFENICRIDFHLLAESFFKSVDCVLNNQFHITELKPTRKILVQDKYFTFVLDTNNKEFLNEFTYMLSRFFRNILGLIKFKDFFFTNFKIKLDNYTKRDALTFCVNLFTYLNKIDENLGALNAQISINNSNLFFNLLLDDDLKMKINNKDTFIKKELIACEKVLLKTSDIKEQIRALNKFFDSILIKNYLNSTCAVKTSLNKRKQLNYFLLHSNLILKKWLFNNLKSFFKFSINIKKCKFFHIDTEVIILDYFIQDNLNLTTVLKDISKDFDKVFNKELTHG